MGRGIMVTKRTPANRKIAKILLLCGGAYLGFTNLNAVSVNGYIHSSIDGVSSIGKEVQLYNQNKSDTLNSIIDEWEWYNFGTENFQDPDPISTDTLFLKSEIEENGKTYSTNLKYFRGPPEYSSKWDLHLDSPDIEGKAFTINVLSVNDTVFAPPEESLRAILNFYKKTAKACTTIVDTTTKGWDNFSDIYLNTEETTLKYPEVIPENGDSFKLRLEKRIKDYLPGKDRILSTEIFGKIDTTWGCAQNYQDTNTIHNGAFNWDTLFFPMKDTIVNNGTALQQVSFAKPIIKGDTIILNYKCDNAVGYKILRKDNNQGDFKLINSTEKSQYKDVVPNGIYDYNLQAIGNNGKVLNEQSFKVKKYGKEECMSKVFYYGQKNLKEELKGREVYDITGKKVNFTKKSPFGLYFIKEYDR